LNFYILKAFKNTHGHYEQASCFAAIAQDSFFMLKPCIRLRFTILPAQRFERADKNACGG